MRILLCLLALLAANIATAGWTLIGTSDTASLYVDKDSVQFSGTFSRVSGLADLKSSRSVMGVAYSSSKDILEFDCVRKEYRYIERIYYSGPMGQGNPVYKLPPRTDSSPADKNETTRSILNVACNSQNRAASENRTAPETKASSSDDRCASWGLKHGTAEYADCQIKLLQVNKGGSSEPARSASPQQTNVAPPVRTAEQKERDVEECKLYAMTQPNPFTAQVKESRQRLYGSPKSYTYSGDSGYGTITENRDHSGPWGAYAGALLGELQAKEEQFVMQVAMQCMRSKGYKPNNEYDR